MTRPTATATDQLLVYTTALPLEWVPEVSSDVAYLIHLQYRNERLLHQLAILEQQGAEPTEEHAGGQELQRIEAKINLLLDLAGDLLARRSGQRPALAVRISAGGVQWPADASAPEVGALGEVQLWLRPDLVRPLCLPARIVAVGEWVEAEFHELGETLVDSLERTIFRYHRRQVAMARIARPQG